MAVVARRQLERLTGRVGLGQYSAVKDRAYTTTPRTLGEVRRRRAYVTKYGDMNRHELGWLGMCSVTPLSLVAWPSRARRLTLVACRLSVFVFDSLLETPTAAGAPDD
jgi:hypothetical protein